MYSLYHDEQCGKFREHGIRFIPIPELVGDGEDELLEQPSRSGRESQEVETDITRVCQGLCQDLGVPLNRGRALKIWT